MLACVLDELILYKLEYWYWEKEAMYLDVAQDYFYLSVFKFCNTRIAFSFPCSADFLYHSLDNFSSSVCTTCCGE